jgi:hypothetical protein
MTSGSMPGTDIMMGYYDATTGEGDISDRWASEFVMPDEDSCQVIIILYYNYLPNLI